MTLFLKLPKSRLPDVFSHSNPYNAFSIFFNNTNLSSPTPALNVNVPNASLSRGFKHHSKSNSLNIVSNITSGTDNSTRSYLTPIELDLIPNDNYAQSDDASVDSKSYYDSSFDINSLNDNTSESDSLANLVAAVHLKSKLQSSLKQGSIQSPPAVESKQTRSNVEKVALTGKSFLPYNFISPATIFSKSISKNLNKALPSKSSNRPTSAGVLTSRTSTPRTITFSYLDKIPR